MRGPPRVQLERIEAINIFFVSFSTEKEFFFAILHVADIVYVAETANKP